MKPQIGDYVLVTTSHRGTFVGRLADREGDTVWLDESICAIRWGTTDGVWQLGETGPTPNTKRGTKCSTTQEYLGFTSMGTLTDQAKKAWGYE